MVEEWTTSVMPIQSDPVVPYNTVSSHPLNGGSTWKRHMWKARAFKEEGVIANLGEGKSSKCPEGQKLELLTDTIVQHGQDLLTFLQKPQYTYFRGFSYIAKDT